MRVRPLCQSLFSIRSDTAVESYYRSVAALFAFLAVTFPDVVKPIISYVTHSQVEDVLNSYGAASQIVSRFRYTAIRGCVPPDADDHSAEGPIVFQQLGVLRWTI